MDTASDLRIAILVGTLPAPGDALLVPLGSRIPAGFYGINVALDAASHHPLGCACCAQRGAIPAALAAMFRARATGTAPFFKRIIVLAPQSIRPVIEQAVREDIFAASRYRVQPEG